MVKSKLLDYWEALKKQKRKNEILFLIYILSHKAIISMAWPASYEIIISPVLPCASRTNFDETGHSCCLKIVRLLGLSEILWARLIIPVCCFVHNYFH